MEREAPSFCSRLQKAPQEGRCGIMNFKQECLPKTNDIRGWRPLARYSTGNEKGLAPAVVVQVPRSTNNWPYCMWSVKWGATQRGGRRTTLYRPSTRALCEKKSETPPLSEPHSDSERGTRPFVRNTLEENGRNVLAPLVAPRRDNYRAMQARPTSISNRRIFGHVLFFS